MKTLGNIDKTNYKIVALVGVIVAVFFGVTSVYSGALPSDMDLCNLGISVGILGLIGLLAEKVAP